MLPNPITRTHYLSLEYWKSSAAGALASHRPSGQWLNRFGGTPSLFQPLAFSMSGV
jgi:hypothetical protein